MRCGRRPRPARRWRRCSRHMDGRILAFEGARIVDAFERQFAFVALTTRFGRESALLTGSAEIKDGIETASVLAVLDATNRWVEF